MNELTLPNNLDQIELEINHHKQIAGQSIWEIGRRLNHVKEHDLVHGQFMEWLEKIEVDHTAAKRMMKIANQLPNSATLHHLGTSALYLIATLPDEAQAEQLERIEQGDSPTVRELQEVKRQLQLQKQITSDLTDENSRLKSATVEVREVVREIIPPDYSEALERSERLSERVKATDERNAFLENQLQELYAQRAEVDEKSAKYDELTKAIQQSQGELNATQSKIGNYKNLLSFLRKGNDMLLHMGGLIYVDEERIINSDTQIRKEFEQLQQSVNRLADDLNRMVNGDTNIIEGVFK
ncbi:DUF3102 domain-containing protein [Streptococcus sp. E17BB]|uniref:DUF3102 domain-containing protein n=1 Tax=Streptococcus sp. E17BB TaxID=3278714 RepID=UPI00359E5ED6